MSGLALAPLVATVPLQLSVDPIWFVAVAVVVFLVGAIAGPLFVLSRRETRQSTPEERDRLDGVGSVESDPDRLLITETADDSVEVSLRGLPGKRVLLLSESVLDELDAETATALIAAEQARSHHLYIEYRAVAAAAIIGLATGMFGGLFEFSEGLFLLSASALGLFWVGRQLQFRADRIAANRVGSDELASAFETVAALRGVDPEPANWQTWFEVQPPLGQRIARLRDRS